MHCLEARQGMLLAVFDLNIIAIGDCFQYRIKSSRVVSDIGLRQEPEGICYPCQVTSIAFCIAFIYNPHCSIRVHHHKYITYLSIIQMVTIFLFSFNYPYYRIWFHASR
jgi:hypothetical protein